MKVQKQREVYLSEAEFSTALREYLKRKGEDMTNYSEGPVVHRDEKPDTTWRLHFYTKPEPSAP